LALCWATVIRLDHSTKKLNLHINIIWVLADAVAVASTVGATSLHFVTLSPFGPFIKQKQQQTV